MGHLGYTVVRWTRDTIAIATRHTERIINGRVSIHKDAAAADPDFGFQAPVTRSKPSYTIDQFNDEDGRIAPINLPVVVRPGNCSSSIAL